MNPSDRQGVCTADQGYMTIGGLLVGQGPGEDVKLGTRDAN